MATTATAEGVTTIRGFPRPLARALERYAPRLDIDAIRSAYELAAEAHSEQRRASGEPFINHAVEVATIVAELQLDTASVVSALVHDVPEDTVVSLQGIRELFGDEVGAIVDGVTKIGRVRFRSSTERQVENYRKLLLSMAQDARVILIKLADRVHNMRTLQHLREGRRRPIARETREIYAPLAHRLGMAAIKWELEDLAFKFLDPDAYANLRKLVRQRRRARERHVLELQRPLTDSLDGAGIPAEVTGRPKHLWSIHRKMITQDRSYDDIYDLMALRVITDSVQHCYAALGIIHSRWTPIQERFHDYVATPKSNMYALCHLIPLDSRPPQPRFSNNDNDLRDYGREQNSIKMPEKRPFRDGGSGSRPGRLRSGSRSRPESPELPKNPPTGLRAARRRPRGRCRRAGLGP